MDDAAQVVRAVTVNRGRGDAVDLSAPASPTPLPSTAWGSWGRGDWIAVGLNLICIALLLISPLLTEHTAASALETMLSELHPYPPR